MTQHTPGPWKIVSTADGPAITDQDNRCVLNRDTDEAWANARLIAAAPELLDACGRARNYLLCSGNGKSHCVDVLQAAIAEATGEETGPNSA